MIALEVVQESDNFSIESYRYFIHPNCHFCFQAIYCVMFLYNRQAARVTVWENIGSVCGKLPSGLAWLTGKSVRRRTHRIKSLLLQLFIIIKYDTYERARHLIPYELDAFLESNQNISSRDFFTFSTWLFFCFWLTKTLR